MLARSILDDTMADSRRDAIKATTTPVSKTIVYFIDTFNPRAIQIAKTKES